MNTKSTASKNDITKLHRNDDTALTSTKRNESADKEDALLNFRELKALLRKRLRTSKKLNNSSIREVERNSDFLLSTVKKIVEAEGGQFKLMVKMPDQKSYNLFDLVDGNQDPEGKPRGPFQEEVETN